MKRMRISTSIAAFLLAVITSHDLSASTADLSIAERYDAFYNVQKSAQGIASDAKRGRHIADAYSKLFSAVAAKPLAAWPNDDIDLYFRASYEALFYTHATSYLHRMRSAFKELERRAALDKRHYRDLHGALVLTRKLSEARALERFIPANDVEATPVYSSVLQRTEAGRSEVLILNRPLRLKRVPLRQLEDRLIVVVAHPNCRFSVNAVRAIMSDGTLSPVFRRYAKWMVPPTPRLSIPSIREWNSENTDSPLTLIFRTAEWPNIDYWGTPTFYFFVGDSLVQRVVGWPEEGRKRDLLEAIGRLQLNAD